MPGKSRGRRSLVGYSPWGLEEFDRTERLHFHFSLSFIGEGNGNPLQCSCLENPMDGGAWWAAVYGLPQSRTRLKWLSSSSSSSLAWLGAFLRDWIPGLEVVLPKFFMAILWNMGAYPKGPFSRDDWVKKKKESHVQINSFYCNLYYW